MITYESALQILSQSSAHFAEVERSRREEVDLAASVGRLLADDFHSPECLPGFDNSAMDGFALSTGGTPVPAGTVLPVRGCLAAGPAGEFDAGYAKEIMTGAAVPEGYDSVVRIEDVKFDRDAGRISLREIVQPGANIRRKGEDIRTGDGLLTRSRRIEPHHLLTLAGLGQSRVRVIKRPKVAVVSTGAELKPFTATHLSPGMIRNSTAVYLCSWLKARGCDVIGGGILPDDEERYRRSLQEAFDQGALGVVSTGAVSVGKFDFVRSALEKISADIHFHSCAIRPGKPILYATLVYRGHLRFVFGLPGNPVSTAVGARFFIEPFLRQVFGEMEEGAPQMASLLKPVRKKNGLRCFYKGIVRGEGDRRVVEALPGQASFMVTPLLSATHWVVMPEQGSEFAKGHLVEVFEI